MYRLLVAADPMVTLVTSPVEQPTLRSFYRRIRPGGPGWKHVVDQAEREGVHLVKEDQLKWDVPTGILCMILGTLMIYSLLFTIGYVLYGNYTASISLGLIAVSSGFMLSRYWSKLQMD